MLKCPFVYARNFSSTLFFTEYFRFFPWNSAKWEKYAYKLYGKRLVPNKYYIGTACLAIVFWKVDCMTKTWNEFEHKSKSVRKYRVTEIRFLETEKDGRQFQSVNAVCFGGL